MKTLKPNKTPTANGDRDDDASQGPGRFWTFLDDWTIGRSLFPLLVIFFLLASCSTPPKEKTKKWDTSTKTTYNEQGLPIQINKNGKITTFKYTKDGDLTEKISPDGTKIELEYHSKFKKVIKVMQMKPNQKKPFIINYHYNKNGLLQKATDSSGENIEFFYDKKGRIKFIKNRDGKEIKFPYEKKGNIIEFDKQNKIFNYNKKILL